MKKVDVLIELMSEWKFFGNGFYELSEEDQEKFKKEILEKLNEEI